MYIIRLIQEPEKAYKQSDLSDCFLFDNIKKIGYNVMLRVTVF